MLGFDVINKWDTELKELNKDKIGLGTISLSIYLSSSFTWLCKGILSSSLYGDGGRYCTRGLLEEKYLIFQTTIQDNYLVIAIDSTGIKVTNSGQWMAEKWNV